jgi:NADH-quinone oxidoreductase subunit H
VKHAVNNIHFIGLGGSGMSGIAEVLHNLGYVVSGSDLADSATLRRLADLGIKTFVVVTMFLWVRATFPRYRYDQIMRLGWKIFIPVTLVWLVVVAVWMHTPLNIWK